MAIVHLSKDNFKEEVLESKVPVLVDSGQRGADHARQWDRWWKRLQKSAQISKCASLM